MSTPATADLALAPVSTANDDQLVYRLLTRSEWPIVLAQQRYLPTPLDQRDGFIHLSTLDQALTTARLYFPHANDLLLMQINAASLWPHLRWEVVEARGGQRFPHYYQPYILLSHVTQMTEMCTDSQSSQHALNPHLTHSTLLTSHLTLASALPPLYKIASSAEYLTAQAIGHYTGNSKDSTDGFIHLSTAQQLHWLTHKFTSHTHDPLILLTLALDRAVEGSRLVWEAANSLRGKDKEVGFVNLFCHIYPVGKQQSSIDLRCVVRVDRLERAADGTLILPADLLRSNAASSAQ